MKNKYILAVSALTLAVATSLTFAEKQQDNVVPAEAAQTFGILNVPTFPNPLQILDGTPGGYAVVSYTLENLTDDPIFNATLVPIDGVTQIVENAYYCGNYVPSGSSNNTCGLGRMDGSFYLGPDNTPQGSCNLLLCVEGSAVDTTQGGIFGGPEICTDPTLSTCDSAGQGVRFNLTLIDSEDALPISVQNAASCGTAGSPPNLPTCVESNPDASTTLTWTISNDGATTAYQIVPDIATLDADLLDQLTMIDTSDCLAVAQNTTCDITAVIPANAPAVAPTAVSFLGSNTQTIADFTSIYVEPALTFTLSVGNNVVPGIVVTDTTTVTYTLTNNTDIPVTISTLSAPTGVAGVTVTSTGTGSCTGATLAANGTTGDSCTFTVGTNTVDPTAAYNTQVGGGTLTVNYNYGTNGYVGTLPVTISVAPTTVTLNGDQPIELSLGTPEIDIMVTNTGNFDWQQVDFEFDNPIGGVTFDETACIDMEGSPANTLPAGDSCVLKFGTSALTSPPSAPTNATVIADASASGSNLAASVIEPVAVYNITVTVDPNFDQLQYQRVLIANNTTSNTIQLTGTSLTGLTATQAVQCTSGSTNCDGYNTNLCATGTIGAGTSCYVLVKSITDPTTSLATTSGTLELDLVDINNNNAAWTAVFPVTQQQMLYVTGRFDRVGGTTNANNIAAFDGTKWYTLAAGLIGNLGNNTGSALVVYKGNLYAGGGFASAGGAAFTQYLAAWDGSQWSSLVGSNTSTYSFITDGPVNSLTTDNTATVCSSSTSCNLLIGGGFTTITQTSVLKDGPVQPMSTVTADGMALWNPANPALTSVSYNAGPPQVSYYGVQEEPTSTSSVAVRTLANATSAGASAFNGTFAGGSFVNAVAYTTSLVSVLSNNIANLQSYESGWLAMPGTNPTGVTAATGPVSVEDLLFSGSTLYVAGIFSDAGGKLVNNIAAWNGSAWAAIGSSEAPGFNGPVYALALFGSTPNQLYAGGAFTNLAAGGSPAIASLAVLDNTTQTWRNPISSGGGNLGSGSINALYAYDDLLYVGGQYTGVDGTSNTLNNLASLSSAGVLTQINGGVTFANGNPANVSAILVTSSINISNNSSIMAAERD